MASEAFNRFKRSMDIGYEQWHDGIGYDLDAIDHLTDAEKKMAENLLIPRAEKDWRDLEALDRLGTPGAIQSILAVRHAKDPQIRLRAHEYGPAPTAAEWEHTILSSLETAEIYSGLIQVLNRAIGYPTPPVIDKLWSKVRDPKSGVAYHCAAALCCITGIQDSMYDDQHRELFLRLVGPASSERIQAVQELELMIPNVR